MPIGYLIPALLMLLSVWYVTTPRRWPRPFRLLPIGGNYVGLWTFAAVVSELPLYALALLAANTVLAASQGDLNSTGGLVALGINIAAALGLLVVFLLSFKTAPVIKRAFRDNAITEKPDKKFSIRALLGPFFIRRSGVRHIRNLAYGSAGKYQTLDVYHKKSKPSGGGMFIHLHGGALRSGKKDRDARPLIYHLAARGWVCISANYRLQPHVHFAEQLDDVRQIVAWAKAHAAEYGGDPNFVMLGGGSSGGHLAAMIGLESGSVDAVAAFYGNFYFGAPEESPITHVSKDAPPFLLLHGTQDNLIPAEGTRRFAETLRRVSKNPVVYAELPNAEHMFDLFNSVRIEAVIGATEAFGAWARKSKGANPAVL